jgi:hypothetical protein
LVLGVNHEGDGAALKERVRSEAILVGKNVEFLLRLPGKRPGGSGVDGNVLQYDLTLGLSGARRGSTAGNEQQRCEREVFHESNASNMRDEATGRELCLSLSDLLGGNINAARNKYRRWL